MFRWGHAALLLLAACACPAQSPATRIVVDSLPQALIQQRLQAVPRKLSDRVTTLESLFKDAGCAVAEQPVPHSKAPNLICTLAGQTESEIVVGGHLDSIEIGMGAIDDWSGASLLPSLYQSLKNTPRRHRFVFVGFAAEEVGLVGSSAFVHKLPVAEHHQIHAMINLECLGLGPPEVWLSRADPKLAEAYRAVAATLHVPVLAMNVDRVGDDDSHSFLRAGIPVLTIHSLNNDTIHLIHQPTDQVAAMHPGDYYTAYRLAAAYLAYLDSTIE